jgi:NADPH2:quinone reductase
MRAAWYTQNGPAREVLIVGEIPTPSPARGEVRVKIATSGVNPSDVKSRRRPLAFDRVVPHSDGAGIIDAVGEGVPSERIGQRVWIWNGQWQRPKGTAAEYIVVPEPQAVPLPDKTDFAAGACLGIPALTAFQAVRLLGDISGKTVFVTGAASAVGHYVTQLAVLAGARVIGTVGSDERAAHAVAAGAFATINYKQEPVAERLSDLTGSQKVDAIVDMDFSSTAKLIADGVLVPHGTVVSYGSNSAEDHPVPFRTLLFNSISLRFFLVYDLTPAERRLAVDSLNALLADSRLSHTIGSRFSLDEIAAAHEAVEGGKVIGNVVLEL